MHPFPLGLLLCSEWDLCLNDIRVLTEFWTMTVLSSLIDIRKVCCQWFNLLLEIGSGGPLVQFSKEGTCIMVLCSYMNMSSSQTYVQAWYLSAETSRSCVSFLGDKCNYGNMEQHSSMVLLLCINEILSQTGNSDNKTHTRVGLTDHRSLPVIFKAFPPISLIKWGGGGGQF